MQCCNPCVVTCLLFTFHLCTTFMQKAHQQLRQVQRLGRGLLLLRPLLQWVVMLIVTALVLGVLDYLLHLPSWVRLVAGLATAGVLILWLVLQLRQALGLKMDLTALALRAERMYPQLSGVLASGVEFAFGHENGVADASPRTQAMTRRSIDEATRQLAGVHLTRLIDPAPTLRVAAVTLAALVLMTAITAAWPSTVWLGAQRWFTPFAQVHWPKRTAVQSLMTQNYWPSDTPLRLKARVTKGHYKGMRLWAAHRLIDADGNAGPWQSQLMSDQSGTNSNVNTLADASIEDVKAGDIEEASSGNTSAQVSQAAAGDFERVIDAMAMGQESAAGSSTPAASTSASRAARPTAIEFQFSSSDDQTVVQRIELIDRPALVSMAAAIEPPAYAQGLVSAQTIDLHAASGQVVTARALAGSKVTLTLTFNKPLPVNTLTLAKLFPTFVKKEAQADVQTSETAGEIVGESAVQENASPVNSFTLSFDLNEPAQSPLSLVDGYGLVSLSQRVYRFEPVVDASPSVSVTKPTMDESVLATAVMDLSASVQDDVGSSALRLEMANTSHQKNATGEAAVEVAAEAAADSAPEALPVPTILARITGRQPALSVSHTLDLSALKLSPGDSLEVWAMGQDIYEHDGQRHEWVKSPVRKLTIIDPADLAARIVQELAGVRQQAVRLESQQQVMVENSAKLSAAQLKAQQQQLSQRIASQQQAVEQLEERQQRNRLDDPDLAKLLEQSKGHLNQAKESSQAAAAKLSEAAQSQQEAQEAKEASESSEASASEKAQAQAKAAKASEAAKAQQAQAQAEQGKTSDELAQLVELLNQGRDAMALQMQLQQLAKRQEELAKKTRDMLPKTLGKTPEQLSEEEKKALAQMAQQQAAMQQQAQELIQKMQAAAQNMSKPQNSARQQAAAQALSQAAKTAQQKGLNQSMQQSAQSTEQNQLSSAAAQQDQSQQTMEEMLEQLNNQQAMQQEILKRQMEKLAAAIRKLIEQQKQQMDAVDQAKEANALDKLDAPALTLRRNTTAVHEQMRNDPELKTPASEVDQSAQAQGSAVESMRANDAAKAKAAQQQSLAHLETALRQLEAKKDEEQKREDQEKRAELRKQYEALAKQQSELAIKTQALEDAGELDRRQRAAAAALGQEETQLQGEARALGEQVKEMVVFDHLHRRIDQKAGQAAEALRQSRSLAQAQRNQKTVERTLLQLAAALKEPPSNPDEFSKGNSGGGGGGGEGGEKPLVPPLAELRLLRDVQQALYEETRTFDENKAQMESPKDVNDFIIELSGRQRELAGLGDKLINKLKQEQKQ